MMNITSNALLILFALYVFSGKYMFSVKISLIHIFSTLVSVLLLIYCFSQASHAYTPGFSDWFFFKSNNSAILMTMSIALLSQFLFVLNLVAGLFRKGLDQNEH